MNKLNSFVNMKFGEFWKKIEGNFTTIEIEDVDNPIIHDEFDYYREITSNRITLTNDRILLIKNFSYIFKFDDLITFKDDHIKITNQISTVTNLCAIHFYQKKSLELRKYI